MLCGQSSTYYCIEQHKEINYFPGIVHEKGLNNMQASSNVTATGLGSAVDRPSRV